MQLFSRKKAFVALSLGALFALGACGDDVTVAAPPDAVVTISITPQSATLNIGESTNLAVQITGGSKTTPPTLASCTSSNSAVATAAVQGSACKVTAVASGNVSVTAAASTGNVAASSITVAAAAAAISNLTTSPTIANLAPSQKVTIVPNVSKAASAVAVTYAYATSAATVATVAATGEVTAVAPGTATITVTASGSGTGFTTTSLTSGVTINVSNAPPAISSLTVQPTSLVLALGATAQLSASAAQPAGAAAAVITYGTNAPAVASVNTTTGLVTGVAPGSAVITVTATSPANASFAAATLTQLVPVTVTPSANITIQDVKQGPVMTVAIDSTNGSGRYAGILSVGNAQVNQPIDITNVRDQIQVIVNLQPNGQRVDSIVAYIAPASDLTARRAAARQLYSNGTANAGDVTFFINTADFTADFTAGTSTVFYPNGQKVLSASVYTTSSTGTASEIQNASNNRQTVNFNNIDGYAASYTNPVRTASNPSNNFNWWGGPGTDGRGTATIVPVFYTQNRAIQTLTLGMRQGLTYSIDICNENGQSTPTQTGSGISQETYTAGPFRATYNADLGRMVASGSGSSTNFTTAGNGNIECRGYEHPAVQQQNIMGVVAATDNQNNPAPIVTFAQGYRFSTAVPQPVANRLDYAAPSTVEPDIRRAQPAVTGWVNASFNFATPTAASTDNGVGTAGVRNWFYQGAGSNSSPLCGDTLWVAMPTATGADIPECSTNFVGGWDGSGATGLNGAYGLSTRSNSPYRVVYTEADRLGNSTNSIKSQVFGVDKTNPLIRFSTASQADTAVIGALSGNTTFQAEFIDERGGFIDGSEVDAINPGGINYTAKTSSSTTPLFQTTYRSQSQFASRAGGFNTGITSTKATCINPNSFTNLTSSGSTLTAGATFLTAPTCGFNTVTTAIGGILGDGYRVGHPATLEVNEGLYHYATRVTDRAGNTSDIIRRRVAVNSTSPILSDILMPATVSASAAPVIGYNGQDNVEIRATSLSNQYSNMPGASNWLRYPQTLVDARFNDNVNSPIAGATAQITVANPYIFGMANAFGQTPTTVQVASLNIYNVFNRAAGTNGNYLSQGVPALNSFDAQFGAGAYTSWSVLPSRAAGFNAPEGLKAQLVSNTNVTNQAFVRVDFFRFSNATADFGAAQWQYLGSSSTAASADVGTTRFWTFTLADANYASLPNSFETKQAPAALGDVILAVGVRSNGAGLQTSAAVGGSAIQLTVTGLPVGANANITITDGASFTQNVTGSGTYLVPAGGNYSVLVGNATFGALNYVPTTPLNNVVNVPNNGIATLAINYGAALTQANVTISGLLSGASNGAYTLTGPSGAQNLTGNNGTTTINVPAAGSYTPSATTPQTIDGLVYTVAVGGAFNVVVGPTPAATAVTFTNTTQRIAITASAPVGVTPNIAGSCANTGAFAGVNANGTFIRSVGTTGTPSGACTVTATAVTVGGITYLPTISNGSPVSTTGGSVSAVTAGATATVTYAIAQPTITIRSQSIGGGTNNLPNGIAYSVRVSSSAYAATGGFQDFAAVTGTDLVIPVPANGTYNVSTRNLLTLNSQQWTVAVVGDVTSAGGLVVGTPALSGTPQNVVVSNIQIGPSGAPVIGDFQSLVTINWTGPTP